MNITDIDDKIIKKSIQVSLVLKVMFSAPLFFFVGKLTKYALMVLTRFCFVKKNCLSI